MKIVRTKDDGYWRMKAMLRSDGIIRIQAEYKRKTYWKESENNSAWLQFDELKELIKKLEGKKDERY